MAQKIENYHAYPILKVYLCADQQQKGDIIVRVIKLARKVLLVLYVVPLPNLKIVYVLLVNPIWKVFMLYSPGINKSTLIVAQNVVNII